jgi:hypothetical protein
MQLTGEVQLTKRAELISDLWGQQIAMATTGISISVAE